MGHNRPGDSGNNPPNQNNSQSGTPLVAEPASKLPSGEEAGYPAASPSGFGIQPGGIAGAAEHIGSAMGSAQRQLRHGLELVYSAAHGKPTHTPAPPVAAAAADEEGEVLAERRIEAIEEEIAEAGRQAAQALEEIAEVAGESLHRLGGRISDALSRINLRERRRTAEHPAETIATPLIAALCIAFGLLLLIRGSHSR